MPHCINRNGSFGFCTITPGVPGLARYPELNFKLQNIFVGTDSLVIYYTSFNGRQVTEFFELNETGKAIRGSTIFLLNRGCRMGALHFFT